LTAVEPHPTARRYAVIPPTLTNLATARTALAVGLAIAASVPLGAGTAPAYATNAAPKAAVARLDALGFSPKEARRLLRRTETDPVGPAGAYAAQRIAMAVLYGNAHAFGGPRYHASPAS
jgi:hypothetical protein